jgi:hypothetical protein
MNLSKFINTDTGKYILSMILGFGLASLFRVICKDKNCIIFHAPETDQIEDKIYQHHEKCYKYNNISVKCNPKANSVGYHKAEL